MLLMQIKQIKMYVVGIASCGTTVMPNFVKIDQMVQELKTIQTA
jgi:hypothetical protein